MRVFRQQLPGGVRRRGLPVRRLANVQRPWGAAERRALFLSAGLRGVIFLDLGLTYYYLARHSRRYATPTGAAKKHTKRTPKKHFFYLHGSFLVRDLVESSVPRLFNLPG